MSAWLLAIGLVTSLGGQLDGEERQAEKDEAIARAVQDLGDPQFSLRRRATRFLWEQGLDSQAALERVADSVDREVRMRAGHILNDFRFGILPGVPEEVVDHIRQFREGGLTQRREAMFWLAEQSRFDTVQRLISLEPDPDARRQHVVNLMRNEQAVQYFLDRDRLEALIDVIGKDQDDAWRRSMLAQALFTETMIQRLVDRDQLGQLVKIVDQEPSADVRRQMLATLFANEAAVAVLIDKGQLDFVLNLIGKDPEQRIRSQWISGLLLNSGAVKTLAADDRLERVLKFAQEHMDDDDRRQAVTSMFQSTTVLKAILDQRGVDRLVAMVGTEKDPEARGQLMATMASSSAVRAQLEQKGQLDLVMKLAQEEKDPIARGHYLKAVLTSSVTYYLMRDTERRKQMWEFVKADLDQEDEKTPDWRGEAVYRILTSYPSAESLLKEKADAEWLFKYLDTHASKGDRSRILERLVADYRLKAALLSHVGLESMLELVKQVGVPQRGRIMGRLFASSSSSSPVLKPDKAELLITLARNEEDAESRRQYLQGLFQNSITMKTLIDGGFYDDLWKLVQLDDDPDRHASLRAYFVRDGSVLGVLQERGEVDSVVQFAKDTDDDDARRTYLKLLFGSSQAMSVLFGKGHFDALLAMAKAEENEAGRMTLLSEFYVNQQVIEQLAKRKQASTLLEFSKELTDQNRRLNFLQRVFYNEKAVTALVEDGKVEEMFALAKGQENKYYRSSLLRAMFNGSAVARYFAKNKKLKELFELLSDEEDDNTRQQIFSSLVNRSETATVIVAAGGLDDMVAAIRTHISPDQQGQLLGRLMMHESVVQELKSREELNRILDFAADQPTINSRRAYLQALFGSTAAVSALIGLDRFDALYELASSDGDPRRRAQCRAQLLSNSATVQHLVQNDDIDLLLKVASEQSDESLRRTIVGRILASQAAVEALAERNRFAQLVQLCLEITDDVAKRRMCAELLLSPMAIDYLDGQSRLEEVVADVLSESDEKVLKSFLERWLTKIDAVAALADHGQFEVTYKAATETLGAQREHEFLRRLTYDATAARLLARPELSQTLLDWLGDQSESQRPALVKQVMQNDDVWQTLIRHGQADMVRQIVEMDTDEEARRKQMREILDAPGGLVADQLIKGELAAAQQLLEDNADDDLGRLRLATFLLATGQLETRIDEVRKGLSEKDDAAQLRLLVYMLRAAGRMDEAREAAAMSEEPGLLKAVLVEQRRWGEAADLMLAGHCPLPIPLIVPTTSNPLHEQVERLGFLAAYHRLAGREAECDATLEEVRQLADEATDDRNLQWYAIEADLLNDRMEQGLARMAEYYPDRVYALYSHQHRYEEALALVGWQEGIEIDRAWLDSISVAGYSGDDLSVARVTMALKAAATLNLLGKKEAAVAIVQVVRPFVAEQPDSGSSQSAKKRCWEQLCRTLLAMGDESAAWDAAAETLVGSVSYPYSLARIYPRSYAEARGWWTVFSKRYPAESPESLFARVHAMLNPTAEEDAAQFIEFVESAARLAPSLSSTYRIYVMRSIASACKSRGRPELITRCFELAGDIMNATPIALADALREAGHWQEASEAYRRVWDEDRDQLAALFLAGLALEEVGQADEGMRLQKLANQLAISSRARLDLAKALMDRGFESEAKKQLEVVMRTAPFDHWEWNDAARLLAGRISDQDPAEAAVMLEYSQLDDLHLTFYLLDYKDYVNVRSIIYRWKAIAAIAVGEFEASDRFLERAISESPASTEIGEEVLPALVQAGQTNRADALFQRLYQPYRQSVRTYPESAYLNNNCAWLAARCGRQLDEALQLAQKAVALAPENGSYVDTLAEVYFQMGDRESAVKHSRRACQLFPLSQTLKDQLQRFETDPLPSS